MTGRFDPARWEITAGMGVREIVLVSAAAGQAIWLVFMTPALPFVVRLVVAVLLALVLLGIALVPIKDKPIEYHLLKFIGYRMRAMGRVYRTARREDMLLGEEHVTTVSDPLPTPRAQAVPKIKQQQVVRYGDWVWVQPDLKLLMTVFVSLLMLGSIAAYFGHSYLFLP